MNSWRESTSLQTQDDFDGLFNAVLPFAEQSLSQHGEFYPYGAVITVDGEGRLVAAHTGVEHPNSDEVLKTLYAIAQGESASLRAVAFVADVLIEGSEAIRIDLEAPEGASIRIVVPYVRESTTRSVTFGTMGVSAGTRHVWKN